MKVIQREQEDIKGAREKREKRLLDYDENSIFGENVLNELDLLIEERQTIRAKFEPDLEEVINLLREIEKNSSSIKTVRDDVKELQKQNYELGQQLNANKELVNYSDSEIKELYKAQNFQVIKYDWL